MKYRTVEQVAESLQISQKTVRALIKSKSIPARKFGSLYRILEEDLKELPRYDGDNK